MSIDYFADLDDGLPEPQPKELRGELTTAERITSFVKAGNAVITLQSVKTEQRFTFKITKPEEQKGPASYFVSLLNGPDNTRNYQYMGIVRNELAGERFTLTRNSKITSEAPSYRAFEYFWRAIVMQKRPQEQWGLRVWHEGRCGRCGRPLTVPESIESGFGPECIKKI